MQKSDFNSAFEHYFLSKKQAEFEKWFADLAFCVFSEADFETIKAGGKKGDKKSDGRRISTETIYQCYAPESPSTFAKSAPSKIRDSFPEVTCHWPDMKEWWFIHNNKDGIPTTTSNTLETIRGEYKNIRISEGSFRFLKDELHSKLSLSQMQELYPQANYSEVKMEDITPLLRKIVQDSQNSADSSGEIGLPDQKKLEFNQIQGWGARQIRGALAHVGIIDRYLANLNRPDFATQIQRSMIEKYSELRDLGYTPNEILARMIAFVKAGQPEDTELEAAAWVVVSYFFDACDIYENPPQVVQ